MDCRPGCGACCIVPGISSPIPGMPNGKPPFTRCLQLSPENLCLIFGTPARPDVCASLAPSPEMCGRSNVEAHANLTQLELATRPAQKVTC